MRADFAALRMGKLPFFQIPMKCDLIELLRFCVLDEFGNADRANFQTAITANGFFKTNQCPIAGGVYRRPYAQSGAAGDDVLVGGVNSSTLNAGGCAAFPVVDGKYEIP